MNVHHEIGARKRRKLLSSTLDRAKSLGVEVGALHSPSILKSEGPVIYVDYTDTAALKRKYAGSWFVDNIVDVDAIWGEATLKQALGGRGPADYFVASHVIEHVPDLVTWLQEIHEALRPDGTLHLVVPDRRYTFDVRRDVSRLADVLYAFMVKARKPLPHQLLDFEINHFDIERTEAWAGTAVVPNHLDPAKVVRAMEIVKQITDDGSYYDTHCWVYTPTSFAALMEALCRLSLINFACDTWYDTERNELEFLIIMRRCDDAETCVASWQRMALGLERGWPFGP